MTAFPSRSLGTSQKDGLLKEVNTGLIPKLTDANAISVSNGMLWSVGYKDIVRFDGKNWMRLVHPDNR
jgi:hypothetical protein